MYIVVNQTKKAVIINDLRVEIPGGSMLDLDKYKSNKNLLASESNDVQHAVRTGLLVVKKKDKANKVVVNQEQPQQNDILGEIKKLIHDELQGIKSEPAQAPAPSPEPSNNQEMAQMMAMMKAMQDMMAAGGTGGGNYRSSPSEYISEIDEDKLMEIHSAAMKRMQKRSQAQSEISYDTNTVKDDNISSDLEGLEDII